MCECPRKKAALNESKEPTHGRILFVKFLLWVLLFLVFFNPILLASQQIERKNVLVLFSFRPTLPVAYQWDRGIQSVFEPSTSHKMVVNIEYLDLMHFDDERYIQILLDIFRYKFFPGVPIVFGGVESKFVENRSFGPNVTGYLIDNNYTGTLDLALNLHPDTRHVAVVAGAGPIGRRWSKACREAFKAYEERVDFTYLIGLPLEALLEKLANLSAHTVVFSLPVLKDGVGKKFIGNESLSQIARVSSAPVYSFRDVNIGTGIVGGYMSSFEEDAKAVAQLGLRILNGEKPEDIPITRAPTFLYMFDWRQLKRWSIAEDKLPQGSIVMFKELTFWDRYKGRIIGAFVVVLFQTLIIFYLLHQRRIRRRAEEELLQLQSELAHINRIVTISALTSALAHEINQPLAAMRSYAQAALRFMDKDQPEYNSVRKALQGIVADNKRAAAVVNRLRDLVKKDTGHWETLEINSIINVVIGLINSEIVLGLINSEIVLRNATIKLDLHSSVPVFHGDSIQIQQVLINLLTNALDAMDGQSIEARTITISTRPENSNGIMVSISDSGTGISADKIQAIFAPFHTTKPKGMGLGLAICKSVIEAHGGKIWADNNSDGGAIFSLTLPADSQIR
jgi:signal transduction histidine kinase